MRRYFLCVLIIAVAISCNNNGSKESAGTDTVYISNVDSIDIDIFPLDSLSADTISPLMGAVICTESLPIPPIKIMHKNFFQRPDGKYDSSITYSFITAEQAIAQNLFTCQQFVWEKDTLLVSFTDGDAVVQQRVIETAKKWEAHCSIVFQFGDFIQPDITVSFRFGINKSCIGTTSRFQSPSIMLTGLRRTSPQLLYDQYVLHEFGHALGLFHEQQTPSVNIPWNVPFLNSYYSQPPNNWTAEDVKRNIIDKPLFSNCTASEFDINSIMIYEIIPNMVTDSRFVTAAPKKLSPIDIRRIGELYPRP